MKLIRQKNEITEDVEQAAAQTLRELVSQSDQSMEGTPSETYFANLLVKTNGTIDQVTSGKALSISWLARVAVPGVVAILFFFIGLHYYVPDSSGGQTSIADAVKSLPAEVVDSLLLEASAEGSLSPNIQSEIFTVSDDQLAEYFYASENPFSVLETMPDQQVKEVASILESRVRNL